MVAWIIKSEIKIYIQMSNTWLKLLMNAKSHSISHLFLLSRFVAWTAQISWNLNHPRSWSASSARLRVRLRETSFWKPPRQVLALLRQSWNFSRRRRRRRGRPTATSTRTLRPRWTPDPRLDFWKPSRGSILDPRHHLGIQVVVVVMINLHNVICCFLFKKILLFLHYYYCIKMLFNIINH